jgi:hypothetical protein
MPSVYIQTFTKEKGLYEFIQSVYIGASPESETVLEYRAEDRLHAAILNLGFACRFLYDNYKDWSSNQIEIESDSDGKDKRGNGEHEILYSLLFPYSSYQRTKLARLYAEYDKYLSRLWSLIRGANIRIKLITKEEKQNETSRTDSTK